MTGTTNFCAKVRQQISEALKWKSGLVICWWVACAISVMFFAWLLWEGYGYLPAFMLIYAWIFLRSKEENFKVRAMKSFIWSCVWIAPLVYLHIFRFREDYAVQSEISIALGQADIYLPSSRFAGADHVCFLTPYRTIGDKFPVEVSEKSRSKLNLKIGGLSGGDDSVWWIIGFRNGDAVFLYKMDSRLQNVNRNTTLCFDAKDFILLSAEPPQSVRQGTEIIFFEIVRASAKFPRPLDAEPVRTLLKTPLPPGRAEAFFAMNTGGDQMTLRPKEAGLMVVVRVGTDEYRQTIASCPDFGLGSALGGGTERELEVAMCDGEFWLMSEPGSVSVVRMNEKLNGETIARFNLPDGVRAIASPQSRYEPDNAQENTLREPEGKLPEETHSEPRSSRMTDSDEDILQSVTLFLSLGDKKIAEQKWAEANDLFKQGIARLGDAYFSPNTIDDTGMTLILADRAEQEGNLEMAAKIRQEILANRLYLYETKSVAGNSLP